MSIGALSYMVTHAQYGKRDKQSARSSADVHVPSLHLIYFEDPPVRS